MLRVGVNLLWLVPGVVGGTEEHTTRLLWALAGRTSDQRGFEIVLFVNGSFVESHNDLVAQFPTVVAPVDGRSKIRRVVAESTWLAGATKRERIDLMHHAGGTMPMVRSCRGIVSIHDLQPLTFPEHFGRLKRMYLRMTIPRSARAASRVLALSDWAKADIVERLGVHPDSVLVVPPGVEPVCDGPDPAAVSDVLERYGLVGRRYFLYPAVTYPHKNHVTLIRALAALVHSHADVCLVLTGGEGPAEAAARYEIERSELTSHVIRPGRIPESDLDVLYRNAVALTFPSVYEGFGIPVVEAMARGCPVLAADATALPEVVGDAGLLVDPRDTTAWTAAMASTLDDSALRANLVASGVARSARFRWARSATALEDVYRTELGKN